KWDSSFRQETLEIYKELTLEAGRKEARFIIWPETAIPFYFEPDNVRDGAMGMILKEAGSFVLTGSPSYNYNQAAGRIDYFNSAYLLSPSGEAVGRYDKVHLVPFGEYVPLKRFLPFIHKLTAGVGDFAEGPGPIPIRFEGGGIGTLICYESIFPELARLSVKNGATVLANLTNDAWFGYTSAPYQHFEMAVVRAVENRVFLLRAANTGISATIDPAGRVRKRTALFEKAVIIDDIKLRHGALTFYTRWGDVFTYGCLALSGIFIIIGGGWIKRRS
ncbi:MAG: apolipoprotein N-acyltransferase, partial [Deltaproteobacteria bacterium]|nr:apolipoprotein N-acyltransferase [Deltaproteobacteria bacterium]